jgi:hypothetical protein
MKEAYIQALVVTVIAVIVFSTVPIGRSQEQTSSYTSSFLLANYVEGDRTYELNVTIPQTLHQYYVLKNHAIYSQADISKFVTPYTLKPIADRLWQIYNNTEDFTNGVLMLVHQINYRESVPGKYPIETLVANTGDCDLFAFIAASILQAGGVNTVLLYYKDQQHMEIGVELETAPTRARVQTFSINQNNASYYIGECTGGKWRTGWRIGETPTQYQNVSVQVITLEGIEQSSIGQVSANLRELDPSTVNLTVSTPLSFENGNITISGEILPQVANENVTLQYNVNGRGWTTIANVPTSSNGKFTYSWLPETGSVAVQASWVGNSQYNGAKSAQTGVLVLPLFLVVEFAACAAAVAVLVIVALKMRHRKTKPTDPVETLNKPQEPPLQSPQPCT